MNEKVFDDSEDKIRAEEHFGLVHMVVKRFLGRGVEEEDLFQIGCLGLVKACERFDKTQNTCFSTYAVPMIQGEIRRALRDGGKIHLGRRIKELSAKVYYLKEKYEKEQGKELTIREMAELLQVEEEEVIMCMQGNQVASLDVPVTGKDGKEVNLLELIPDLSGREDTWVDRVAIGQALERLTDREKRVIYLRFFREKSQSDVAKEIDLSQAQVSRIEKSALCNLRLLL